MKIRLLGLISVSLNVPLVWNYLGKESCFFYLFSMVLLLFMACRFGNGLNLNRLILYLIAGSALAQLISLFVISPQLYNGMDRDSALITFIQTLLRGNYPYQEATRNGNPISVLPFMPLVAFPFYLLGNVGLLQIASFLCLAVMLWKTYDSNSISRFYSIFILSTSPLLFFEVIARSDLISNITILLFLILLIEKRDSNTTNGAFVGILMGCALSTRLALFPAMAIIAAFMHKTLPCRVFSRVAIYSIVSFVGLTVPLAIWEPGLFFGYAPFGVNLQKLGQDDPTRLVWLITTGVATFLLAFRLNSSVSLYIRVALVMSLVTLATWKTFWVDLSYLQLIFLPLLFSFPRKP